MTDLWTPERVEERIEEALRIAVMTGGRVGPKAFGSTWPEYQREFADKTHRSFEEWLEGIEQQAARKFTSAQLSLADEALRWPIEIVDHDLMRDALWLVCLARVCRNVEVKWVLARRRRKADAMLELRKEAQPDIVRIYEDDAGDVATQTCRWANAALSAPLRADLQPGGVNGARIKAHRRGQRGTSADEIERLRMMAIEMRNKRIKAGARFLFARGIRQSQAIERIVTVRRTDVMPGRNFWFAPTYKWFGRGTAAIAAALIERGAPVR